MSLALTAPIAWTVSETKPREIAAPVPTMAEASINRQWRDRQTELLVFGKFRDDWDGFGAAAPDVRFIDAALSVLQQLRQSDPSDPPARVALAPDGLVAIEWQGGGQFVSAEIASVVDDGARRTVGIEWMRAMEGQPGRFQSQIIKIDLDRRVSSPAG